MAAIALFKAKAIGAASAQIAKVLIGSLIQLQRAGRRTGSLKQR